MKVLGKVLVGLLWVADLGLSVWCLGAIWFLRALPSPAAKLAAVSLFALLTLAVLVGTFWRRWIVFAGLLLPIAFIACWLDLLKPTGRLDWDVPFQRMPHTTFAADGHTLTIENVRDFRYRAEFDYDVRYRTETYDLNDIVSMDYSITHWNDLELFGHIILTFGFKDGRHLALSPEARLEKGKVYEFFPGFYRVYELIFIAATEEDVFGLRTHHRAYEHEEVLLYPTHTDPAVAAFLLKDLLLRANALAEKPEFYNGIFYNCLSSMAPTAEKLSFRFCSGWRGTFNGISDRLGYWTGWLKRKRPDESFAEMRERCSVNKYVEGTDVSDGYSRRLRKGF